MSGPAGSNAEGGAMGGIGGSSSGGASSANSSGGVVSGTNWQLILADLALILFLVTLTALPQAKAERAPVQSAAPPPAPVPAPASKAPAGGAQVDAAQALFRPLPGGPALGLWLQAQPRDPRATLTIFAAHPAGGEAAAWRAARALAQEAAAARAELPVRIIIAPGPGADLYASLAYDTPLAASGEAAAPVRQSTLRPL